MKALLVLLAVCALPAQVISTKTRFGDDLRWANPAYDDSAWTGQEESAASRFWNRYRVRVPPRTPDPVIGVSGNVFEVYADGRLIGRRGAPPPVWQDVPRAYSTFSLPADLAEPGRVITVAVRRWDPPGVRVRGFADTREIRIHAAAESFFHEYHSMIQRRKRGGMLTFAIMAAALVLLLLGRPRGDRSREFVLVMAFCASFLAWSLSVILVASIVGVGWLNVPNGLLIGFTNLLGIELLAQLAGVRPDVWIRGGQALFLAMRVLLVLGAFFSDTPPWLPLVAQAYPYFTYGLFAVALYIFFRRQRGGGVSDLPVLVLTAAFAAGAIGAQGASVQGTRQVAFLDISLPMTNAGFLAFGVTLCGIMLVRFRTAGTMAAQLQGQMAAAREAQQMLLERRADAPAGYAIDSVYVPAENVGGDFFRVLPAPDGSTLVVVGDVSGKGLRAAMVVSVVIGALLNRHSHRPAEVLAELNRALTGQLEGGFVTCLIALLQPDGRIVAANAGHPQPYRDGGEIALPDGLPLGIVRDGEYEEAEVAFLAGSQWTMLTDGVVEAENGSGELFGFDRTRDISGKSAREIADAAKAWGQTDDITVVTVRGGAR
jgi:sigma-B regulation protein RsbU (phosphoserine phosphatase)